MKHTTKNGVSITEIVAIQSGSLATVLHHCHGLSLGEAIHTVVCSQYFHDVVNYSNGMWEQTDRWIYEDVCRECGLEPLRRIPSYSWPETGGVCFAMSVFNLIRENLGIAGFALDGEFASRDLYRKLAELHQSRKDLTATSTAQALLPEFSRIFAGPGSS